MSLTCRNQRSFLELWRVEFWCTAARGMIGAARDDGTPRSYSAVRSNSCRISVVIRPTGEAISVMIEKWSAPAISS